MKDKRIVYRDLGLIDYHECWEEQKKHFSALLDAKSFVNGKQPEKKGTVILCEHPHVYTLGKSGTESNLLISEQFLKEIGAVYYKIDRGGDITYHGPGQLVGYPILDLERLDRGLKQYVHSLEEAVINTIAEFGIEAGRSDGATGVWLKADDKGGERKICAIGVKSSKFITMHGFSLNVNTDLRYFSYINPCGFIDRGVTSMENELGRKISMADVKAVFLKHFSEIFGLEIA